MKRCSRFLLSSSADLQSASQPPGCLRIECPGYWSQKKPRQLAGLLLFAESRMVLFVHFYYKHEVLQAFDLLRAGRAG
jgi:hypothetical protein